MSLGPIPPAIEISPAMLLRAEIYDQLGKAAANEIVLDQSWMRLGRLLASFKAAECWRELDYGNFDAFMLELRDKYHRGRTQLWAYLSVAETLGSVIPAETLERIGISKAMELKRAMVRSGKQLPAALVAAAEESTTTIKELRGLVGEALNLTDDRTPGTWFDFDGCFMTKDEREEFKAAVIITEHLLELSRDLPDHMRRKVIFFAWLQEFIGTHAAEVNGPAMTTTVAKLLPVGGADRFAEGLDAE